MGILKLKIVTWKIENPDRSAKVIPVLVLQTIGVADPDPHHFGKRDPDQNLIIAYVLLH